MSKQYIPAATSATVYYEPKTEQEMETLIQKMSLGDMIFNKWAFPASGGMWYTMGLMDENEPDSKMLFPNIVMDDPPKPLTHWGMERMAYLKEHNKFLAMQLGTIGLYKHCLEIEEQAAKHERNMMESIQKDPANRVTLQDKNNDPIAWEVRMNSFQVRVQETIYSELIHA